MTAQFDAKRFIIGRMDAALRDRAARQRFDGEIWENSAGVPMGRGYANRGKPFDIEGACYLKPVMQAIRRRPYGKFIIRAAVQTLKTFATIEEPCAYFIQHAPGDMAVYLVGDDTAQDQAKARLMPRIKSIPGVAAILDRVTQASSSGRFDITTTEFYLPGMVLRVWPLNETTTQRISLRYVLISDAFLSKKTGMIAQAIARTTQHNTESLRDYKIIIESQGGEDGDDFDSEWQASDQRRLHVNCIHCGQSQPFEFHRRRPYDFQATVPKAVPSLDASTWLLEHTRILNSEDRRDCGFKRGPDDKCKLASGQYDAVEILKSTAYECYYCGGLWHDKPEIRKQLDASSHFIAENRNPSPDTIGFSWPAWCGQRIAWGSDHVMMGYLKAKERHRQFGDIEPLKQWYQKRAAKSWSPELGLSYRVRAQEVYDLQSDWPEEWSGHRCLIVDCQQDLQYFWASVWAVSRTGKSRQLWRGVLHGDGDNRPSTFESQRVSANTIVGVQKRFGVRDQSVFLDGGYMRNQVVEICSRHGHWATINGERMWMCWTILVGSRLKDFAHAGDGSAKTRHPISDPFYEYPKLLVDKYRVSVEVYYFSALQMGDMAARYRDGQGPETLFLPEAESAENKLSWTAQINACTRQFKPSRITGEASEIWLPPTQTTPHHYWDILRMFCAVQTLWGLAE